MIDIKKMIRKTGQYPVKDSETGRISLVRPKKKIDTKERLEYMVDKFYYENDIEHRNPKNWDPLPRRLQSRQPAVRRPPASQHRFDENDGEESSSDGDDAQGDDNNDEPRAHMRDIRASHGQRNPENRRTHAEPAFFAVDSRETSPETRNSRNTPCSSQGLEEGVRGMSLRATPIRHAVEKTSDRRPSRPHEVSYQVIAPSVRSLKPRESSRDVNITGLSSRSAKYGSHRSASRSAQNESPRNLPERSNKLSGRYSDRTRSADARSSVGSGGRRIPATLDEERECYPDRGSKGRRSRTPTVVEVAPVQAEAGDPQRSKRFEHIKPLCLELKSTKPLQEAETPFPAPQSLKDSWLKVPAQDRYPSKSTDKARSSDVYKPTYQYAKSGQSLSKATPLEDPRPSKSIDKAGGLDAYNQTYPYAKNRPSLPKGAPVEDWRPSKSIDKAGSSDAYKQTYQYAKSGQSSSKKAPVEDRRPSKSMEKVGGSNAYKQTYQYSKSGQFLSKGAPVEDRRPSKSIDKAGSSDSDDQTPAALWPQNKFLKDEQSSLKGPKALKGPKRWTKLGNGRAGDGEREK